ncbi:nitroreductase family protein [Paucilactobacillus suebicus]|uniref:Nitroreductase domain-containing protein n=1 Tax=Paucilactobacillus suebicus DSM 5007 = KCTC 3549 TaxID=1423807 RepID=A0A0R1VY73_9LACO|nr:nitroreductase family protein [Paucilactobacillus suebicus]KRM10503.1 hypothetical protein FD16_GL001206 [Paucilactobacillus suebicus DSM 5007 = KCTC 3549]
MEDPILARHAVRSFQSTKPSSADIDQLIAAFQAAPCGMGQNEITQGVVVESDEFLQKVEMATNNAAYGAPLIFVIATKDGSEFGDRNASVAAENVLIEATRLGLGSVYVMSGAISLSEHPDLVQQLGIDDGYSPKVIVPIGKATEAYTPTDRSHRYKLIRR